MKKCSYCGRQNEDTAVRCSECGTEIVSLSPPEVDARQSDSASVLVSVGSFATISQASLLKTSIEAAGIEACIPAEYASQVF